MSVYMVFASNCTLAHVSVVSCLVGFASTWKIGLWPLPCEEFLLGPFFIYPKGA